jgi:hypothetical protein
VVFLPLLCIYVAGEEIHQSVAPGHAAGRTDLLLHLEPTITLMQWLQIMHTIKTHVAENYTSSQLPSYHFKREMILHALVWIKDGVKSTWSLQRWWRWVSNSRHWCGHHVYRCRPKQSMCKYIYRYIYVYLFICWELTLWINTSVDPTNCMTQQVPARCVDIVTGIPVKGFV